MKHLVALSLLWLPHLTGSPVDSSDDKPHGYAPYVWITVHTCNGQTGWCQGQSRSGFALTVDNFYNRTSDTCTHYCPGMIYAHWRPFRDDPANDSSKPMPRVSMLGAYVKKLDRSSCLEVPGGFKCSDRIVANTPLNKISILLYASPRNRDYYFGDDPMADCGTDPHVLSYVGLGDAEALSACHAQLGDSCFVSQGNRFCVGYSRAPRVGITNADAAASAPIAICEVSSAASLKGRAPAYKPTPEEIRDFLTPSSCDATVLSVESAVYSADHLSVELDVPTFYTVAEVSHVIMKVSLDECLLPSTGPADRDFSAVVYTVAKTLSKVRVSTHSTGIMLDATDWGMTACKRTKGRDALNFTRVAAELASALSREGVLKLFLRLPRSLGLLNDIAFSQLDAFDAFVTPPGAQEWRRFLRGGRGIPLDSLEARSQSQQSDLHPVAHGGHYDHSTRG
ncbi:hypothetical protein D5F01_LYC23936 [Larimichthys crocea]|uniref:Uncharacterized protein n=1 Tax=Larimichthys crocea TaxID=215358 RepID=A0A6G0HG45_LARCR|nr:hypothetical protein D5F01_LYC23936 [Larimichthys crocea]